jgi:hypothetical protein
MIKVDLGEGFAHGVIFCPRFRANHFASSFISLRFGADLCTPGRNMPQISGRLMHPRQKYAPNLR